MKTLLDMGTVERYHTLMPATRQTTAHHSWGVAMIILTLHPKPSLDLIRAALMHDMAEKITGDAPYAAKREWPEIGIGLKKAETEINNTLEMPKLTQREKEWLKAADQAEAFVWCRLMNERGDRRFLDIASAILDIFRNDPTVPDEIKKEFLG